MANDEESINPKRAVKAEEYLPEIAVNLSAAALIWLFGVLVFLPIAAGVDPTGLSVICSLLILSTFSFFLIKGSRGIGEVLDVVSRVLAHEWRRRRELKGECHSERTKVIKVGLRAAIIVITFLLYSPLLATMHPSISGIAFIIAILWILRVLHG